MATFILTGLLSIIAYELFVFIHYPPGVRPDARETDSGQERDGQERADTPDIMGKSTFDIGAQLRQIEARKAETERKAAVSRGEMTEDGKEIACEVAVEDCQLEEKRVIVQVPDEELDDMFAEPDAPMADGNPLNDIDLAFDTARQDEPDEQDERKAADVFRSLEGTELLDEVCGRWPEVGENIRRILDKYYGEESEEPKGFFMPDRFEDFNVQCLV